MTAMTAMTMMKSMRIKKLAFIAVALMVAAAGCSRTVTPGMPTVETVTPSPAPAPPLTSGQRLDMAEQGEAAKKNAQHLADQEKPAPKD